MTRQLLHRAGYIMRLNGAVLEIIREADREVIAADPDGTVVSESRLWETWQKLTNPAR